MNKICKIWVMACVMAIVTASCTDTEPQPMYTDYFEYINLSGKDIHLQRYVRNMSPSPMEDAILAGDKLSILGWDGTKSYSISVYDSIHIVFEEEKKLKFKYQDLHADQWDISPLNGVTYVTETIHKERNLYDVIHRYYITKDHYELAD